MKASLDEKAQFLSQADPDFKVGTPSQQNAYLVHLLTAAQSAEDGTPTASSLPAAMRLRTEDGTASPSGGFGVVAPSTIAASPELIPSPSESTEEPARMPSKGFGSAYVRPEVRPEAAEAEPPAKESPADEKKADMDLPKAALPQQKTEEGSPEAKAFAVSKALDYLFEGAPDARVIPQQAELPGSTRRLSAETEQLMTDANLSEHAKNIIRATMTDEEASSMLRKLRANE
jgi:hypothetical protein